MRGLALENRWKLIETLVNSTHQDRGEEMCHSVERQETNGCL